MFLHPFPSPRKDVEMDLKDSCTILLERATQKVKCYKFKDHTINRELALHEDLGDKNKSSVTDIKTGCRLFTLPHKVKDIKENDIREGLNKFINHYTVEAILSKVAELDKTTMEERFKKGKKAS